MFASLIAMLLFTGGATVAHDGTIHTDDGSIVIKGGPRFKTNPTWICPNGQSGIPPNCP